MKTLQIEGVTLDDFLQAISSEFSKCLLEHARSFDSSELLTRKQVRDKFGLSYSTIHRHVVNGILTPSRIGSKVYFDSQSLTKSIRPKVNKGKI